MYEQVSLGMAIEEKEDKITYKMDVLARKVSDSWDLLPFVVVDDGFELSENIINIISDYVRDTVTCMEDIVNVGTEPTLSGRRQSFQVCNGIKGNALLHIVDISGVEEFSNVYLVSMEVTPEMPVNGLVKFAMKKGTVGGDKIPDDVTIHAEVKAMRLFKDMINAIQDDAGAEVVNSWLAAVSKEDIQQELRYCIKGFLTARAGFLLL